MKKQQGIVHLQVLGIAVITLLIIGFSFWKISAATSNSQQVAQNTAEKLNKAKTESLQSSQQSTATTSTQQPTAGPASDQAGGITSNSPQQQINAAQSATPAPSTAPANATLLYRIEADGTAKLAPVSTQITSSSGVKLTVSLTCVTSCNFRLVSDAHSFDNTVTYTSSQKIEYHLKNKGSYLLYNEYSPTIKAKITIN